MGLKVYAYKNCGTCRKALKWLDERKRAYTQIPIRERPPTKTELRRMLGYLDGDIKKLFNTSGGDYKALNLKDKLPKMSRVEAIDLLSGNGNLVKRPFALSGESGTVGFKEDVWQDLFL
ncbi:MAG: arsenate reductase family protein [Candidatus Hydrogenedentes bacterium]|nr:arsenate reductase family protein [Candidatus Hydrogenedentota bacterium]